MKYKLTFFALFIVNLLFSQDTIKVMQYNLLYYGKQTDFCTTTNNNVDKKNGYLKTIIQHIKPDIFSVNELDGDSEYPIIDDASYLLDNALNVDGVSYYRKADFPKVYLANTIFYNSNKLRLKESIPKQFTYGGVDKIFNVYKLYYNAEDLAMTEDTAFIYCLVAHLKAGSYPENQTQRDYETNYIMDYFESIGEAGNFLILGDFNVYSPTESAFQNLINPDNSLYTFYDPADQIGEWSRNYDYRYYHTQSTHESGECYSGGGMDDRFDFILASNYVMSGIDHFEYITDSYKTIGQDGSNYNGSLNTSTNTSVPTNVAQALYNMSDHLPVYLELKVDQNRGEPLGFFDNIKEAVDVIYNNPASENLNVVIKGTTLEELDVEIISITGVTKFKEKISVNIQQEMNIPVSKFSNGMYLLNIYNNQGVVHSSKFVIKK